MGKQFSNINNIINNFDIKYKLGFLSNCGLVFFSRCYINSYAFTLSDWLRVRISTFWLIYIMTHHIMAGLLISSRNINPLLIHAYLMDWLVRNNMLIIISSITILRIVLVADSIAASTWLWPFYWPWFLILNFRSWLK